MIYTNITLNLSTITHTVMKRLGITPLWRNSLFVMSLSILFLSGVVESHYIIYHTLLYRIICDLRWLALPVFSCFSLISLIINATFMDQSSAPLLRLSKMSSRFWFDSDSGLWPTSSSNKDWYFSQRLCTHHAQELSWELERRNFQLRFAVGNQLQISAVKSVKLWFLDIRKSTTVAHSFATCTFNTMPHHYIQYTNTQYIYI